MRVQLVKSHLVLGTMSALLCFTAGGCLLESSFNLASESRLPKWETLPAGAARADVSLTVNYYTTLWGGSVHLILEGKNKQTIDKKIGTDRCEKPFLLGSSPQARPSRYPNYDAITVNGITEILEQKKPEDILYVTDDPAVWKQYLANGCD